MDNYGPEVSISTLHRTQDTLGWRDSGDDPGSTAPSNARGPGNVAWPPPASSLLDVGGLAGLEERNLDT